MSLLEKYNKLINFLLNDMPQYKQQALKFDSDINSRKQLFRSLMNVWQVTDLPQEYLTLQNEVLQHETSEKGVVQVSNLKPVKGYSNIYLWQGDITRLNADAIVNAANSALLGCFIACHACIDNAIHSASGLQLRAECNKIMQIQNHDEKTGDAKITAAYNLPCKHVLHTVGPIVSGNLTQKHCNLLKSCYVSCLKLASKNNLKSVAFCCISTGEFHFPNQKAAEIATETVLQYLHENNSDMEVVFNVFKQQDYEIYKRIFAKNR